MGHNSIHRTRKACNFELLKFPEVERIKEISRRAYARATRRKNKCNLNYPSSFSDAIKYELYKEAYTLALKIHNNGLQVLAECNTKWEQEDNNVSL